MTDELEGVRHFGLIPPEYQRQDFGGERMASVRASAKSGAANFPTQTASPDESGVNRTESHSFGDAFGMATDWALGIGPDHHVFGPGTDQVNDMMDAPGVNGARDLFYEKNADRLNQGLHYSKLMPVTNYRGGFGWRGLMDAKLNWTRQFVGSYRVDAFPIEGDRLIFVLNNRSSMRSFLYGVGPSWDRASYVPTPGGNMDQVYWWIEPIKRR